VRTTRTRPPVVPTATGAAMGLVALSLAAAGSLATAPGAAAVACSSPVRFATSTNTLYVDSGTLTLPDVKRLCAAAPLEEVAPRTWYLRARLAVRSGAVLRVAGGSAGAVDTLRLASPAIGGATEVVDVTADGGTLTFDQVAVTSWDPAAAAPDTDHAVPAGAPSGARGRAFVRALSQYDAATGRATQGRMDITDSVFSDLGYAAAEAYGVSYKARGCDAQNLVACANSDVVGSQRRSRFLRNYMGTYTYNAYGMVFDGNEYAHNVTYGLDPHDDSDHLTITGNHAHHNGSHGIICSQRCDHLVIRGNESAFNGVRTATPAEGDGVSDGQVHGIMLHRGVTDSVVEGNSVHDHPTGAGIAVFDSHSNTISGNTVERNAVGLRSSVGSRDNLYDGNTIRASTQYAVNIFPGVKDQAVYGVPGGRPAREVFRDTVIDGVGADGAAGTLARVLAADGVRFEGTRVAGTVGSVQVDSSAGFRWDGDAAPGTGLTLRGDPVTAALRLPLDRVKVTPGPAGKVTVTAPDGRLAETNLPTDRPLTTRVTPAGAASVIDAELVAAAGTTSVALTPRPVRVAVPAGQPGSVAARISGYTSSTRYLHATAGAGAAFTVRWAGLVPNATYVVRVDGSVIARPRADAGGELAWTWSEPIGAARTFTLRSS